MNPYERCVSPEVAQYLKRLGFDWKVNTVYWSLDKDKEERRKLRLMSSWENYNTYPYCMREQLGKTSAPYLSVAKRWVKEMLGIYMDVNTCFEKDDSKPDYFVTFEYYDPEADDSLYTTHVDLTDEQGRTLFFADEDEALHAGLEWVLRKKANREK
jgi:hypothetical protein